jgi:hypothetical protein
MESRFREINFQFDIILDDSDHVFESHIKIVRTLTKFLKPGGMLIIEDVSNINFSKAKFRGHSYAGYAENFTVNNTTPPELIESIIANQKIIEC